MGAANATIVVSFSDDALSGEYYMAELDAEANGDKTSFPAVSPPPVYFIIQHDATLKILNIVSTNGSISGGGTVSRTKTDTALFAAAGDDVSLPCDGSASFSFTFGSASVSVNGSTATANSGSFPALANVSVRGTFKQYALNANIPPLAADETYDVYIVIYFGPA